jgi:hypothetical protein
LTSGKGNSKNHPPTPAGNARDTPKSAPSRPVHGKPGGSNTTGVSTTHESASSRDTSGNSANGKVNIPNPEGTGTLKTLSRKRKLVLHQRRKVDPSNLELIAKYDESLHRIEERIANKKKGNQPGNQPTSAALSASVTLANTTEVEVESQVGFEPDQQTNRPDGEENPEI